MHMNEDFRCEEDIQIPAFSCAATARPLQAAAGGVGSRQETEGWRDAAIRSRGGRRSGSTSDTPHKRSKQHFVTTKITAKEQRQN